MITQFNGVDVACVVCIISKQGGGRKRKKWEREKHLKRNEYFWFVVDSIGVFAMAERLSRKMNNKVVGKGWELWFLETS